MNELGKKQTFLKNQPHQNGGLMCSLSRFMNDGKWAKKSLPQLEYGFIQTIMNVRTGKVSKQSRLFRIIFVGVTFKICNLIRHVPFSLLRYLPPQIQKKTIKTDQRLFLSQFHRWVISFTKTKSKKNWIETNFCHSVVPFKEDHVCFESFGEWMWARRECDHVWNFQFVMFE